MLSPTLIIFFEGWYDQNENLVTTNQTLNYYEMKETVNKYYARFSPTTLTNTYKKQYKDESGVWVNLEDTDDQIGTLSIYSWHGAYGHKAVCNPVSSNGYRFVGWVDENGNAVESNMLDGKILTYDVTINNQVYIARFEKSYSIRFISQLMQNGDYVDSTKGGVVTTEAFKVSNISNGVTVHYAVNEDVDITANYYSGYIFVGWFNQEGNLISKDKELVLKNIQATSNNVTYYARFIPNIAKLESATLYIGNKIGINFYVTLPANDNSNNYYLKVFYKQNNQYITENGQAIYDQVNLEGEPIEKDGIKYYRGTVYLYPYNMADYVVVGLFNGDKIVSSGQGNNKDYLQYSVMSYANRYLQNNTDVNNHSGLRSMLQSLLVYGSATQDYAVINDWGASSSWKAAQKTNYALQDWQSNLVEYQQENDNGYTLDQTELFSGEDAGIYLTIQEGCNVSMNMRLSSSITVDQVLIKTNSTTGMIIYQNEEARYINNSVGYTVINEDHKKGFEFSIDNIPIYRWNELLVLEFYQGETKVGTLTYSVNSYIQRMVKNTTSNDELVRLLKAMYLLSQNSSQYFESIREYESNNHNYQYDWNEELNRKS